MEDSGFSNDAAQQFMQTWSEAGTQALKGWFDLMGVAAEHSAGHPAGHSAAQPQSPPVSQQVASYQELQFHLLKLSYNTWQDLWPQLETGVNWQTALEQYNQKLRDQVAAFSAGRHKTNLNSAELWQIYSQEMQKLSQTASSSSSQPWIELNNLYWNLLYEKNPINLAQMPLLEPSRDFNHKLAAASEA